MNEIERENQKLAAAASILYAGGISQRAISAKLGIEQSRVSRLLHRAEKEFGWIQIAPQVIKDRMPAEVLADAELLAHEDQDFEQLLGAWSPYGRCRASVIYSGGEEKLFYRLTADIFGRLLVNCQSVGVLYGRTLWQMVSLLDQQKEPGHSPLHRLRHIDFVPLCGEPINLMFEAEQPPSHSASHIAEAMQRLAGHQTQGLIASLSGIHAYIKRGDQRGLIQDYFQSTAAFKKIFSEPMLIHFNLRPG